MPTIPAASPLVSEGYYSSSVTITSHGNVLKQLLMAGKSHESANKSIYSADSSPASSPSTSPINYSSTQVQVQVHVQTQTVIQKSLYTNTNTNEAPMNLTTNFSSCSLRQQPHDIWSPPVLSPPPAGDYAVPGTPVARIENYPEPPYFLYNPYFLWQLSSYRQLCQSRAVAKRTC